MFDTSAITVAIGLVFCFAATRLSASTVNEAIASLVKLRVDLRRVLSEALLDAQCDADEKRAHRGRYGLDLKDQVREVNPTGGRSIRRPGPHQRQGRDGRVTEQWATLTRPSATTQILKNPCSANHRFVALSGRILGATCRERIHPRRKLRTPKPREALAVSHGPHWKVRVRYPGPPSAL